MCLCYKKKTIVRRKDTLSVLNAAKKVLGAHFCWKGRAKKKGGGVLTLLLHEESVDELLITDLTRDSLSDGKKLGHLAGVERVAECGESLLKILGGDEALALGVECAEGLEKLLLAAGLTHTSAHHVDELGEIEVAITARVGLGKDLLEFVVADTNTVLLEDLTHLGLGDGGLAAAEHLESFLELTHLVVTERGLLHFLHADGALLLL